MLSLAIGNSVALQVWQTGPDFNIQGESGLFNQGGILRLTPNVAGGIPKPPENQSDELSRNLRYGIVGVSVILAVVIGIVFVLVVNWINL